MAEPTLRAILARRDGKGLPPQGVEGTRALIALYPANAINDAIAGLPLPDDADRAALAKRLRIVVANYVTFRQAEVRTLPKVAAAELRAVGGAASALIEAVATLGQQAHLALEGAFHEDGHDWIEPSPAEQASGFAAALMEQCRSAIARLPPQPRGQPVKAALLHHVGLLANIYAEATGRRPARSVNFRVIDERPAQRVEEGAFRIFANAVLGPAGGKVSDWMAREALMSINTAAEEH